LNDSTESFFATKNPIKIQEKSDELHSIINQINWRDPEYLKDLFGWLKTQKTKMNNQSQATSLFESGLIALQSENWHRLTEVNYGLFDLLRSEDRGLFGPKIGFGL